MKLDVKKLNLLSELLRRTIDEGELPGASVMVIKDGEEVFKERTSLVFKTMQVVRFLDKKRNTLVDLVYSDRLIEGSPQNAVTAIPILPMPQL